MAWNSFATPLIGKAVRAASRLAHGGGSAFPGKIVERIDPQFLARTLQQLPLGVVLVSGTNGKTTTTRMVASMLESLGLKVFTNPTGSNFTRGVVSSLLAEVSLGGKLDADIAVLELDEAYAVHFVKQVQPDYCLLLNVMRDQLDRFGEIDNTARLLSKAAEATTGTVVLNREDPRIARLADVAHTEDGVEVRYFGLDESLRSFFPSDDDMHTTVDTASSADTASSESAESSANIEIDDAAVIAKTGENAEKSEDAAIAEQLQADVTLLAVGDHRASFGIDGETYETGVRLEGVYNLYNAAAALAVVRAVASNVPAVRAERNRRTIATSGNLTAHDRFRALHYAIHDRRGSRSHSGVRTRRSHRRERFAGGAAARQKSHGIPPVARILHPRRLRHHDRHQRRIRRRA